MRVYDSEFQKGCLYLSEQGRNGAVQENLKKHWSWKSGRRISRCIRSIKDDFHESERSMEVYFKISTPLWVIPQCSTRGSGLIANLRDGSGQNEPLETGTRSTKGTRKYSPQKPYLIVAYTFETQIAETPFSLSSLGEEVRPYVYWLFLICHWSAYRQLQTMPSTWFTHPRKFGPGSRSW